MYQVGMCRLFKRNKYEPRSFLENCVEDILIAAFSNVRTLVEAFRERNHAQRNILKSFIDTKHVEIVRCFI